MVSPYIEAMLAGDGDPDENIWTEYKLKVVCQVLWNIYETVFTFQKQLQSATMQVCLKRVAVYWMKFHAMHLQHTKVKLTEDRQLKQVLEQN